MKIAVVFNPNNIKAKGLAPQVEKYIVDNGGEIAEVSKSDYVLSLGGDGTLIHQACDVADLGIPVFGINTGNLGFLTAAEAIDWKMAIDHLLSGKVFVSERMTLEISVGGKDFRAVNEAAVKGLYRVVELEVGVRGEDLLKISGDGVIVATQSGSTAYSLSAGGPIVDSELDSILVTPINPIGLPIPSVVLSPDDEVEVKITRGVDVSLIIDGQEHMKTEEGKSIKIKRGKHNVKLAYLQEHQFLKALNAKFGLSKRNLS